MSTFILVIIVYNDSKQHDDSIQRYSIIFPKGIVLGSTVVSPYVGMARKQNGGYNASISVQTLIFHLVVNSTRLKTVRICSLALPQLNSGTKIARKRC